MQSSCEICQARLDSAGETRASSAKRTHEETLATTCDGCETVFCAACVLKFRAVPVSGDDGPPQLDCPICIGTHVTDRQLLEVALGRLGLTKKELSNELTSHAGRFGPPDYVLDLAEWTPADCMEVLGAVYRGDELVREYFHNVVGGEPPSYDFGWLKNCRMSGAEIRSYAGEHLCGECLCGAPQGGAPRDGAAQSEPCRGIMNERGRCSECGRTMKTAADMELGLADDSDALKNACMRCGRELVEAIPGAPETVWICVHCRCMNPECSGRLVECDLYCRCWDRYYALQHGVPRAAPQERDSHPATFQKKSPSSPYSTAASQAFES